MRLLPWSFCGVALSLATASMLEANAAEIPIVNPSFEDPVISTDGSSVLDDPDTVVPGWTCEPLPSVGGGCGVWNPTEAQIPAREGAVGFNVGYFVRTFQSDTNGLSQVLAATLQPGLRYRLKVWVVLAAGFFHYPMNGCSIRVDANAGSTVLGQIPCLLPNQLINGTWFLREFPFGPVGPDHPALGTPLRILISGSGANPWDVEVDDVSLTATVPDVPTLSAPGLGLLAACTLVIGLWATRRYLARAPFPSPHDSA